MKKHLFLGCWLLVLMVVLKHTYVEVLGGAQDTKANAASFSSINNIKLCDRYSGSDAGAKIAACVTDLPSTGGTADARGLEGAQTIEADFFSGVTKPGTLLLGAATFRSSVCLNVPSAWTIRGDGTTVISRSGRPGCILGGENQNHVGILIQDIQLKGNGIATYGIDLSYSTVGADCYNRVGPNVLVESTTNAAVKMTNCGGSTTYITHSMFRELKSGLCIDWSNTGGNTLIQTVSCVAAPPNRYGVIKASGQLVSITDSSFQGFEGTDLIPNLYMSGNYIYAGPSGSCVKPQNSGDPRQDTILSLTVISGLCVLLQNTDSYLDGKYGSVHLLGTAAAAATTGNFFGSSFGGIPGATRLLVEMKGGSLAYDGNVKLNLPSVANADVDLRHAEVLGQALNYYQGVYSVGGQPTHNGTNALEVHNNGTDALLFLDNSNTAPSQWVLDAANSDRLLIFNSRASTGTISVDPGPGENSQLVINRGYFFPASKTFTNLGTPINGAMVICSDCVPASNPCVGGGGGTLALRRGGAWVCF